MRRLAVLEGAALDAVRGLAERLADACRGGWRIESVFKASGGYEVTLSFEVSKDGDLQRAISIFQRDGSLRDESKGIIMVPVYLFVSRPEGPQTRLEAVLHVYKVDR